VSGPDVSGLVALAEEHVAGGVPACQLALARDGEVVWVETFGDASDATRFCIFSATKPIVASAVWLLIGDGLLDTSARVVELVPEFATNGKDVVTVEQVLLHTAGFPTAPMGMVEGADPERRRARFGQCGCSGSPGPSSSITRLRRTGCSPS
jgi:CubicO group peptidase (beta-lactamase class C family)